MASRSALGRLSVPGRFLRPEMELMEMTVKTLAAVAILLLAVIMTGCATVQDGRHEEYYKEHGAIWRIFHPRVIADRPLWQQTLYWAGPGHCPFCRGVLYATTRFDDWPSPYYEAPATSESVKAGGR